MLSLRKDGEYEIKPLPVIGKYNVQRFPQFSPEDVANFYVVPGENTKRPFAMYPTLGRQHITYGGINRLIFSLTPRTIFRTINYWYVVVGSAIYQIDKYFNQVEITQGKLASYANNVYYDYLVVNQLTFVMISDNENIYVYEETSGTFDIVTDPNAPGNFSVNGIQTKPGAIVAFGNRFAVSCFNSSQFVLSAINLLTGSPAVFDPTTCFTISSAQVFAQENGIIRQMGVLNNTLYIFTDFTTGIWANIPAVFSGTGVTFPWKKNSTYDWNFGIANPFSLDIDFGYMCFLAQNKDGLLQVMASSGSVPEKISDKAIDVLFQQYVNNFGNNNPFFSNNSNGFLYQYENAIFYRLAGGDYTGNGILDQEQAANAIEYNFEIKEWHRSIELNGERSRIQQHLFFDNTHFVSIINDTTIYELSDFYINEVRNPDQPNPQTPDAYLQYPFRYERVMPIISQDDYSEFETEYAEIDFVFGNSNINFSTAPFQNAVFIVDESSTQLNPVYIIDEIPDSDGQPVFMIDDQGNTPSISELTYNTLYKPSIELFFSDDGGISFNSADVRVFSQEGQYQWRMRWYQLGASRNRVYKLVAVSPVPIVILGGVMNVRRLSGGAN